MEILYDLTGPIWLLSLVYIVVSLQFVQQCCYLLTFFVPTILNRVSDYLPGQIFCDLKCINIKISFNF